MPRVRGALPLAASFVVAVLGVLLLAFSGTLNPIDALMGRGAVVTVPDVEGRALPRAKSEISDAGLDHEVSSAYSLSVPRGSVIGQDPRAGERVRQGEVVELIVSSGANRVEMPDAVGAPLDEVSAPLEDAGVPIDVVPVAHERVPEGVVLSQDPDPGVVVTGEDRARFEVSSGPAERPVPEVVGLSVEAAAFRLGDAGLGLGEVTFRDDSTLPVGAIAESDPPAGSMLARDAKVGLVVSAGAAPVQVPRVTNLTSAAATDRLESLGFLVTTGGRLVGTDGAGAGAVVDQVPSAGTRLRPGEVVTIVVGRVPPEPPPTTTSTVPPPTTTSSTAPPAGGDRGG